MPLGRKHAWRPRGYILFLAMIGNFWPATGCVSFNHSWVIINCYSTWLAEQLPYHQCRKWRGQKSPEPSSVCLVSAVLVILFQALLPRHTFASASLCTLVLVLPTAGTGPLALNCKQCITPSWDRQSVLMAKWHWWLSEQMSRVWSLLLWIITTI